MKVKDIMTTNVRMVSSDKKPGDVHKAIYQSTLATEF